ncbi:hypothetical protein LPJ66_002122 [Kickxella alabastrina]|uniref:Uncharacterized protein n=1 Tax=Kickxella alabastrina TaxID=61397 RepID=A0ACC1IRL3_9FUNG|nr:hypothetical protein LPJ66_002122 [Kickxella alabastrina]
MSFKFNFGVSDDGESTTAHNDCAANTMCIDEDVQSALSAAPCEIIPLAIPRVSSLVVDAIYYGQQRLWKRQIDDVQFQLAQQDSMDENESSLMRHAIAKDKNASDVIKGVYEGGLKTWECSIDLLSFLVEHQDEPHMALNGARVLELGCGTGLPSLHILKTAPGAHVCMQDYNRDVLELVTMPNVLANTVLSPAGGSMGDEMHADDDTETCEIDIDFRRTQVLFGADTDKIIGEREVPELTPEETREADLRLLDGTNIASRCEFVAGDWANIEEELRRQGREHSFDLVLTSETIYDTDSYKRLHDLLVCVLARPDVNAQAEGQRVPMVLVAAKSIYFGLSGSILLFSQYVRSRGVFDSECVWQSGGSMNREILRLTWINSN